MDYRVTDWLFDTVMPKAKPSTFKVVSFIVRKTAGWGKEWDFISISQIQAGTGIVGRSTTTEAINEAIESGWIVKESVNGLSRYAIPLVLKMNQQEACTSPEIVPPSPEIGRGGSPKIGHTNNIKNNNNINNKRVYTPAKAPAHFENFNALTGNGDIGLSADDKLLKIQLVNAIKAIVTNKTALPQIYDLADTCLEKKVTPEVLTKLFGAGGWWFTTCKLNSAKLPPYVKNIVNELDTALATLEVKETTPPPIELTPAVIMRHIDSLRGLQNGARESAWKALPPEVTRVINEARKKALYAGFNIDATQVRLQDLQAVMVKEIG